MTPSVRKVVLLGVSAPALSLNFTTMTTLDQAVTFSRAGLAFQFDSTGKLTWCPNNTALQSNTFSTTWTKQSGITSVTANVTGPDGVANSAWTVLAASGTNGKQVFQTQTVLSGSRYANSIIAKAGTASWVSVAFSGGTTDGAYFNLSNGTVGTVISNTTAEMISLGNGWYRCTAFRTSPSAFATYEIHTADNQSNSASFAGTETIFICKARFSALTYETSFRSVDDVDTTSAAYYGPRLDYDPATLAPKGLLIEESRTNLITRSNDLTTADWGGTAITVTNSQVTGPDGTSSLAKLQNNTGAANPQRYQIGKTVTNIAYTGSFVAKAGNLTWIIINLFDGTSNNRAWVNLSTGAVGTVPGGSTVTTQNLGNGIWRLFHTRTLPASANAGLSIELADGDNVTTVASTSSFHYAGYGQFEAGSFGTSYILTGAATVTRAVDFAFVDVTPYGLSSSYSLFVSGYVPPSQSGREMLSGYNVSAASFEFWVQASNGYGAWIYDSAGSTHANTSENPGLTDGAPIRWAATLRNSIVRTSINGRPVQSTSIAAANGFPTKIYLGSTNGPSSLINEHITKMSVYRGILSDTMLQSLQ